MTDATQRDAWEVWADQVGAQLDHPMTFDEGFPLWRGGWTVAEAVDEIRTARAANYDLEEGA
jgi:hypothetical protein